MNPLLEPFNNHFATPPFDLIKTEHFYPAFQHAMKIGRKEIADIKAFAMKPDFGNTIEALERSGKLLGKISAIFFNLNSAETNDEMQKLAQEVSPLLSQYGNDISLDHDLFQRVKVVFETTDKSTLTLEQNTLLEKTFKSFVRNGANLSAEGKIRLREIDQRLSAASLRFGEHVLSETNKFTLEITRKEDLEGLPESVIEAAAHAATERKKEGIWIITLQHPSYVPLMTYAQNRNLRELLFKAASSKAYNGNEDDNRSLVLEISILRNERALLLGYPSFAHFVLEERMAESPEKVINFLEDLLAKAKPAAMAELALLSEYAQTLNAPLPLQKWDVSYYAEKLKKSKFDIDDTILKPYFKLSYVIDGIFEVAKKLYGLSFNKLEAIPVYHKDVDVYEVKDENSKHVALFYTDLHPRTGKRSGAWMTSFRGQCIDKGQDQRPLISIVCNFTKPGKNAPSLLTFNEVTTLFHEFGHALHGMLANTTYESLSGTNVFWDFVELPSQVLENWAYQKETLDLFARHYISEEPLPVDVIEKLKESKNFMAAYQAVRQVGLSLLDLGWHTLQKAKPDDVDVFEKNILKKTELLPSLEGTNISCSYSHIFQGGYAAGYYSYKWAEVLDADAFEFFELNGIFNKKIADSFKENILSAGGREHPMDLYKRFRGQEPTPDALLRRTGLVQ